MDLGHKARNGCLLRVAEILCRHPGGTLPTKLANPADYKAMDRLMNRPETTYAGILSGHLKRTRECIARRTGVVTLVLHDGTTLDYSGLKSANLGQVGNGGGHGYLCHNSLAVDPQRREILGLANQILHRRAKVKKGEGVKEKRERKNRESRLWSGVEAWGVRLRTGVASTWPTEARMCLSFWLRSNGWVDRVWCVPATTGLLRRIQRRVR